MQKKKNHVCYKSKRLKKVIIIIVSYREKFKDNSSYKTLCLYKLLSS